MGAENYFWLINISPNTYYWLRFWHFMAFISWMAVLFYLPRLFVYHAENIDNKHYCEVVKIQERKLFHGIGWIAMIVTIVTGVAIWLLAKPDLIRLGYFHIKLTCAVLLIIYHFSLWHYLKQFAADNCFKSGKFFRFYNEVPTIIMAFIVYAMIIKANF